MWYRIAAYGLMAGLLVSCANAMRSYNQELTQTRQKLMTEGVDSALGQLDKDNALAKDILFYLEKGEALRLARRYKESFEAFEKADVVFRTKDNEAAVTAAGVASSAGSYLVNDKVREYEATDYEKVLVPVRQALNHIALGDLEKARIEVKRSHEREGFIARINEKKLAAEQAEKAKEAKEGNNKAPRSYKEINGYPVATLDDPELNRMVNSYQNALSHYLAGFVYENLAEPSLAAPGYRKAIELKPNDRVLEAALKQLDAQQKNGVDVLILVEEGFIPYRKSQPFRLSVPSVLPQGGVSMRVVSMDFPVMDGITSAKALAVKVGGQTVATSTITDLGLMSKRALKDDMPMIVVRSFARLVAREVTKQVAAKNKDDGMSALMSLLVDAGGAVLESADERAWRLLPERVHVARLRLPAGNHELMLGQHKLSFEVKNQAMVVPVRIVEGRPIQASASGKMSPYVY